MSQRWLIIRVQYQSDNVLNKDAVSPDSLAHHFSILVFQYSAAVKLAIDQVPLIFAPIFVAEKSLSMPHVVLRPPCTGFLRDASSDRAYCMTVLLSPEN